MTCREYFQTVTTEYEGYRGKDIGQNQMEIGGKRPSDMCASRNIKYSLARTCEMITYSAGLRLQERRLQLKPTNRDIFFFELWRAYFMCN